MVRFLRNFILISFSVAMASVILFVSLGDYFINRAESPLTTALISRFRPEEYDNFGYTGGLKFVPFRLQIDNLYIESEILRIQGMDFDDARIDVELIICDAWKLIEKNEVEILGASGRSFTGTLTYDKIMEWLESNSDDMRIVSMDLYNRDQCRVTGHFGIVSVVPMTIIGTWGIDDRGVVTLLDREFYNPDGTVPEGMIEMLEDQISFDIRISVFSEELTATEVVFDSEGLTITASESG